MKFSLHVVADRYGEPVDCGLKAGNGLMVSEMAVYGFRPPHFHQTDEQLLNVVAAG